ncbi:MAG: NADH dehydrogenase [ubiquinone] 1 alpha subcomplex assembly factor 6 [Paracoccaceae bacterium]|jgi:NADH dehydrogenase [ubiquinone] 1 alpha subcomplex assembly factor 6
MPPQSDTQSHADYCAEQVRTYDYHRYFAATFAHGDIRRGLIALYAFNLEIASIRERVSEALLGQMRLQWWRDTIGEIYGGTVRNHAVVSELAWTIEAFDLPRQGLEKMVDGRMFDLEDEPPEDSGALTVYASATSGRLAALAAHVCGQRSFSDRADAVGTSWGMTGLLRALPYQAAQRRVYMPKDILRASGLTPDDVVERRNPSAMKAAVTAMIGLIDRSRPAPDRLPRAIRPAIAYAALADPYLRRLKRAGYDVYAGDLEMSRLAGQMRIFRTAMTGKT